MNTGLGTLAYCKKVIKQTKNIANTELRMDAINICLTGYGVENIRGKENLNSVFWGDAVALYVNMGDPYIPTVVFETRTYKFIATDWASWVEKNQTKYGII